MTTLKTALIVIYKIKLNNRNDLPFPKTHPLVYSYLTKNFKRREEQGLPAYVEIFQNITES